MKPSPSEVLRVVREHSCYELAEHYLMRVERLYKLILEALDCGAPAAKMFLTMYTYRRGWTCSELAAATSTQRQNVNVALKKLMGKGLVERVGRRKWRVICHIFNDKT